MPSTSPTPDPSRVEQMVTQQVRAWNVTDDQVLNVLRRIPRETFVAAGLRHTACADTNLPMAGGQLMLAPKLEGKILQALQARNTDTALVIGAANAHLAACLASLVDKVTLQDADPAALEQARQQILSLGVNNVTVRSASPEEAIAARVFNIVVVTGAVPGISDNLQQALAIGGRLFAVTGSAPVMEATLITRSAEQSWQKQSLFETVLPILPGTERPSAFEF